MTKLKGAKKGSEFVSTKLMVDVVTLETVEVYRSINIECSRFLRCQQRGNEITFLKCKSGREAIHVELVTTGKKSVRSPPPVGRGLIAPLLSMQTRREASAGEYRSSADLPYFTDCGRVCNQKEQCHWLEKPSQCKGDEDILLIRHRSEK